MEVRWSALTAQDLDRIYRRIARDNPSAAKSVIKTLYDGCAGLRDFPERGRDGRMNRRREFVFPKLPYIAVYRITKHAVEISRIYHTAQDWP
jgi:toxin ParE1/3/4